MNNFFEWIKDSGTLEGKPWLILGKGPGFSKRSSYDLSQYYSLSLNHVVREQSVDVAHIIDIDVVESCSAVLSKNARVVVMPWIPHFKNKPGKNNLGGLIKRLPILYELDRKKKLLWYNLNCAPQSQKESLIVEAKYFSAEAALNLLARAGVKRVYSLGVDGGAAYCDDFTDLNDVTRLNNGLGSYNRQFRGIAKTLKSTDIFFSPLDSDPVKIFVGSTEKQGLACRVLEYSVRQYASITVDVIPLYRSHIPLPRPKDRKNYPRTPFSFQRFLIPELCEYRGRALYLDSDMLVFRDIRELWAVPFGEADILSVKPEEGSDRPPQFSVMLMDCFRLKWQVNRIIEDLDAGVIAYDELVYRMCLAKNIVAGIDSSWNSLESFKSGETSLLHYTDTPTQPWLSRDNPLGYLWCRFLFQALQEGFIKLEEVERDVKKAWVRPSLLYQIENNIDDPILLPRAARRLDRDFLPPHKTEHGIAAYNGLLSPQLWKSLIRHYYFRSPASGWIARINDKILQWGGR